MDFHGFVEKISDPAYYLSQDGRLRYANQAWLDLLGYRLDEALGLRWTELVPPEERASHEGRWASVLAGESQAPIELTLIARGGRRLALQGGLWPELAEGTVVGAWGLLREAPAEELRRARRAAEEAGRAKCLFLANMSHEIRTPLNGVIGMIDLVLDTDLAPQQQECLETGRKSAGDLLALMTNILDFAQLEAGALSLESVAFGLRGLLEEMMPPLAARARQQGLQLAWRVSSDTPDWLIGSPRRLRQVLGNLVENAMKFTPRGKVTLTVESESLDSDRTQLHFAVHDTGIGIAPDQQKLIFEPFSQADPSTTRLHGGAGLGLSLSARLVARMGGRIWMESRCGQGSTFHFTVQLARPSRAAGGEGAAAKTADSPEGGPLRPDAASGMASAPPAPEKEELDLDRALEKVGGDREVLRELAEIFLDQSPQWEAQIEAAVRRRDPEAIKRAAHKLVGAVANFFAGATCEAAVQLEELGGNRRLDEVEAGLQRLQACLQRLKPALRELARAETNGTADCAFSGGKSCARVPKAANTQS